MRTTPETIERLTRLSADCASIEYEIPLSITPRVMANLLADHVDLVKQNAELVEALSACANRLETCAVLSGGNSPEVAALAVKEYRDLIKKVRNP